MRPDSGSCKQRRFAAWSAPCVAFLSPADHHLLAVPCRYLRLRPSDPRAWSNRAENCIKVRVCVGIPYIVSEHDEPLLSNSFQVLLCITKASRQDC